MNKLLYNTLNDIICETSNIPSLNSGGCCEFTKLLSKQLESRGIKYKILMFDDYQDLNIICNDIKNKLWPSSISHVAISVRGMQLDGTKIDKLLSYKGYRKRIFELTHKDLDYYCKTSVWNPLFDLDKYKPIINKIIIKNFKKYDLIKNGRK